MKPQLLPLFPLPAHILPEGLLPLRIFESRYLRMVKESFVDDRGFGVCMIDSGKDKDYGRILPIGTRVRIIDFYHLDDGLLGVTVQGIERFRINAIDVEPDGLKIGRITYLPNWPDVATEQQDEPLAARLHDVFDQYPELDELYHQKHYDNLTWLCQRWLEILPMPVIDKQVLIERNNVNAAREFLTRLIDHAAH